MNATIQSLILDCAQRLHWLVWVLIAGFTVLALPLGYAYATGGTPRVPMFGVILAQVLGVVVFDVRWRRIVLTLPVSQREIARAQWWVAFGVPALWLTALSLLSLFAAAVFRSVELNAAHIAFWLFSNWGLVAVIGLYVPYTQKINSGGRAIAAIFTTLWILAVTVIILAATTGLPSDGRWLPTILGIDTFGLVIVAHHYFRGGAGAIAAGMRGAAKSESLAARTLLPNWPGLFGYATEIFVSGVLLGAFYILFFAAGDVLLSQFLGGPASQSISLFKPKLIVVLIPLMMTMRGFYMSGTRVLRCLPLTTERLATYLLLLTLMPIGAVVLPAFALVAAFFPDVVAGIPLAGVLIVLAIQALAPAIHLRLAAASLVTRMLASAALVIPCSIVTSLSSPPTLVEALVAAIVLIVASFCWIRHELLSGRHAYRPRSLVEPSFSGA